MYSYPLLFGAVADFVGVQLNCGKIKNAQITEFARETPREALQRTNLI
jgi:hypothetical protein